MSRSLSSRIGLLLACAVALLLVGSGSAWAQTGTVAGTVLDADNQITLPGVNVAVVGFPYGAATDEHGRYRIIGLPPGVYTLRASFIGYADVVVEDVRVQIGLTTPVDITLREEALGIGGEIVVTAERPPVQRDRTASVQYLGLREIEQLPVTSTREALFVQAGVFFDAEPLRGGLGGSGRGEPRYAVRGGDQTEVIWFLDGHRTHSLIEGRADRGGSYTTVNHHAVQELQILTGGFNAEYGGAQSGIVNVVTREGRDRIEGSLEMLYGPTGQRHFGNYLYDPSVHKEFLDHTLEDGTLDPAWWTPERQSQIYDYRQLTDRYMWSSLGGPLPFLDGGFFVAAQHQREAYAFPRPIDHRTLNDLLANVVLRPSRGTRLKLQGLYSQAQHSTIQQELDFSVQAKYYRGWGSVLNTRHALAGATWTQTITPNLFYDLRLSTFWLDFREEPSPFTRLGQSENPTIWGYQRFDGFENEPFDAYSFIFDRHERIGDVSLAGSVSWQFDSANLLKAGFEGRVNRYSELRSYRFPSFSLDERYWQNRGLNETYYPIELGAYIQDRMEFLGMILNIGLRYDYFNPNRKWFTTQDLFNLSVNPEYDPALDPEGDQVDAYGRVRYSFDNVLAKPRSPAPSFHRLSPRIGVSFPITEGSVVHFNYGHFYQMPPLDRMFEFEYFRPEYLVRRVMEEDALAAAEGRAPRHIPSDLGSPERVVFLTLEPHKPEKTISFEVGLSQQFGQIAVLNVTGFYKDIFDQVLPRVGLFDRRMFGYDPLIGANSTVSFASHFSGDYGDSRGFEVNLRSLFSEHVAVALNYSFARATQGRATPSRIDFDAAGEPAFTYDTDASRRLPTEKTFSRPHLMRANLYLVYPEERTGWYDRILGGTRLSLLGRYVSGRAFTYLGPDDPPDTVDNQRFPDIRQLDMRLDRRMHFGKHAVSLFAMVTNVFNTRNLRAYGDTSFDPRATPRYLEDGTITDVDGFGYDISWMNYFPPRRATFGLRYDFR
jgi:hypothetical protein